MSKAWIAIAKRGGDLLDKGRLSHGERLAERGRIANELGVSGQTLRNYIAAYEFASGVEKVDPNAAATLWALPAAAVEIYARWAGRDRRSAFRHLLGQGKTSSVAAIIRAERSARANDANPTPSIGELLEPTAEELRSRLIRPEILRIFDRRGLPRPEPYELEWRAPDREFDLAMGVAEIGYLDARGIEVPGQTTDRPRAQIDLVATVPIGRSDRPEFYRSEAKPNLARALALGPLFPLIIILLPDTPALLEFEGQLPPLPYREMGASGWADLLKHDNPSTGQPLRVTSEGSIVMVTSLMDVSAAYFDGAPRWFEAR